ncbi:MAG: GIY-YIG nuclease family protein [Gammaproteobacteria bacterium]|nr:GIY-YIG nuclease family protein [Gammaproteobacteria bacterium]
MAKRNTYNYTFRVRRKVSHRGITNNPARREQEHRQVRPGGKLTVDGRAKTRKNALRAERKQTKTRGYFA